MLIEFSVGNYRSFKEKVTFSMVAANLVAKDKDLDDQNVFEVDPDLKLLKSAAIYGANASGKSNLAGALVFMKWFMINSHKDTQIGEAINVEPFLLSTETETEPSFFELVFLIDNQNYRYGFEATQDSVISEWLFYVPKRRETNLFERNPDQIKASKSYNTYNTEAIQQWTRPNALFLSVSAQNNVKIAVNIVEWLTENLSIISGLDDTSYLNYTIDCLSRGENKNEIIHLMKKMDLSISDIDTDLSEIFNGNSSKEKTHDFKKFIFRAGARKEIKIYTFHHKYDKSGNISSTELFDMDDQESEGTKKVFTLSGPIADTLKHGKTLVVDELDSRLHPLISRAIVNLFNSNDTNPNNAQLIFMTHDTNLLDNSFFRRDQIWFTEKNRVSATDLYSLSEYKIRNDASFESDYIKGRYGAIPYIGNFSSLIDSHA